MRLLRDQRGSAPAEFLMVSVLLTTLTLAVLQIALALYVRNVVHDATVEGAFYAALADTTLADGEARVTSTVDHMLADGLVQSISATEADGTITMRVRATLPLLGLWGVDQGMEITAYAPAETLDR